MPSTELSLPSLILPQYIAGNLLPDFIQQYLNMLAVEEISMSYNEFNIVYTGKGTFKTNSDPVHNDPAGGNFTWDRNNIHFRLIIPRDGAAFIDTLVNLPANNDGSDDGKIPDVKTLLNDLRPVEEVTGTGLVATEYPAVSYRLELLVDVLNFTLGSEWKPGRIDPSNHRVVLDTGAGTDRVKISLPKVLISFTQGDEDNNLNPQFKIESWGVQGFDTASDLGMGSLIDMNPSIAMHESGRVAFSVDEVVLDVSKDNTPPEIMDHFGVDEEWTGVYIKQLLLYVSNEQGIGFNVQVKDALISFAGEVSLEASLDVYTNIGLTLFSVTPRFYEGPRLLTDVTRGQLDGNVTGAPSGDPQGRVSIRKGGQLQLQISGGNSPYTTQVTSNGSPAPTWNTTSRNMVFDTAGTFNVFIHVEDSNSTGHRKSSEYIQVTVTEPDSTAPVNGTPADNPASQNWGVLSFNRTGNDATHDLAHTESDTDHQSTLEVTGGSNFQLTIRNGSDTVLTTTSRTTRLQVPNGANYTIQLVYGSTSATPVLEQSVHFRVDKPFTQAEEEGYVNGTSGDNTFEAEMAGLQLPDAAEIDHIEIDGYASYDTANDAHDLTLSQHRANVVKRRLEAHYSGSTPAITVAPVDAHGHYAEDNVTRLAQNDYEKRKAVIRVHYKNAGPVTINGTLTRTTPSSGSGSTGSSGSAGSTPAPLGNTPAAPPPPNNVPPAIKQLGVRVKLERNSLSLFEFYGKIDFQTELEDKVRTQGAASGSLDLTNDGVVDFKLGYMYDQASGETTLTLLLHSDENDRDGLFHMDNNANRDDRLKNIFGALLLFAPIINAAATAAAEDSSNAGAWVGLGASIAVPVAIGALNVFRTRRVILYGGEIVSKFVVPKSGEPLRSFDIGIVFDYEVQFDIIVEALGIGKNRLPGAATPLPPPLRARYKAIGFNINYHDFGGGDKGFQYVPVFDSSKGYDLDLSDPSLFSLPSPLGDLFNIAGARLARFNPVTLEIDFVIKVDLGIITVDKFKLKIPLDPVGTPQILPSGVRVNIPGVLVGNGFVEIIDKDYPQDDGSTLHAKGVQGGLDLTLVSLKVRISGNIGVNSIKDNATGREAIAVFVGLTAQFPTPIVLGATGLGLYGISGLFAMHYKRLEDPVPPGSAVGPALAWLIKAEGEPTHLKNSGNQDLWIPAFDKWSFGIGAILGTVDGGILMNFQGMLILELPGPRILIMVKVRLVTALPKISDTAELTVGILGVIDIDFNLMQITLGVMINFEIPSLLKITLPIEIFFKLDDPSNWHLYIGTIAQPASAEILGIVRGSAYLMIQGSQLDYGAPEYVNKVPQFLRDKKLNAIAVATGLEASILLGDEGAGIYLRLAAGAHIGISFSPFLAVGSMYFTGQLRLIIISISANGHFDALISKLPAPGNDYKVYLHGEICGSIDLFFFEISACIGLTIGDEDFDIEPPKLVRGLYLQSFSPVLTSGQGGSRPIDASLGNAKEVGVNADPAIVVPIDSIPVLQLQASPLIDGGYEAASFTKKPGQSPDYRIPDGWIQLSDKVRIRYIIKSITLKEGGAAYPGPKIDITWRLDKGTKGGADTAIDLAMFTRVPTSAEHAVERSTQLKENLTVRWENACKKPAPPASVLYTFCSQPIGPSANGWVLRGKAKPDPAGTVRVTPVNTRMTVYQPRSAESLSLLDMVMTESGNDYVVPAQVVGLTAPVKKTTEQPVKEINPNIKDVVLNPNIKDVILNPVIKDSVIKDAIKSPIIKADVLKNIKIDVVKGTDTTKADLTNDMLLKNISVTDSLIKEVAGNPLLNIEARTVINYSCFRALQIPYHNRLQRRDNRNAAILERLQEYNKKRKWYDYVIFETGSAVAVQFFGAIYGKFYKQIIIEELDENDKTIISYPLADLNPKKITAPATELPADWLDASLPWRAQVVQVASFMYSSRFNSYDKILFTVKPSTEKCVKLKFTFVSDTTGLPPMYIGIAEVLETSEVVHNAQISETLQTEQNTLQGYLAEDEDRVLLKPGTTYQLAVNYNIEVETHQGVKPAIAQTQTFEFRTDNAAPQPIDPYVLGTTPVMDEHYQFFQDPVKVVFNDASFLNMYEAYGKQLKAVIRGADGIAVGKSPDTVSTFENIPASVKTPYREMIETLIAEGVLPCMGSMVFPITHPAYIAPFDLKPLMPYTFDLEFAGEDASPTDTTVAKVPLFRRSFVTSRYADLTDFANDIRKQSINHKALTANLTLPAPSGPDTVVTVTDIDMENALRAAGVTPKVGTEKTGATILWSNQAGDFIPYAILIDAAEPMWRIRIEAQKKTVLNESGEVIDPAFVIYENQPAVAMQLRGKTGESAVRYFIKTQGGTRTLAILTNAALPAAGIPCTIEAVQPASTFYALSEKVASVIAITLTSKAPWED